MRHIRVAEIPADPRPDGRNVKQLGRLQIQRSVEEIALLQAYHPADFEEQQHCHPSSFEIFYFLQDARYRVNGEQLEISAGDLLILEPGEPHGAIDIDHEVNILVLQVPYVPGDKQIII